MTYFPQPYQDWNYFAETFSMQTWRLFITLLYRPAAKIQR